MQWALIPFIRIICECKLVWNANMKMEEIRVKRKIEKGISILLSLSMVFSAGIWLEGMGTKNPAVTVAAAEEVQNTEETVYTDEVTGFQYTLYEEEVSDGEETTGTLQKASITGYTGTDWDLVIPANVTKEGTEIPVGSIADEAFKENEKVTGVNVPEGVEIQIGYRAFYGCPNLTSVSLLSAVTWESDSPYNCHKGYIFDSCESLKELALADEITVLPTGAFRNCAALESVRLPSHLESFEDNVFESCTSLTGLEIPEGVQEIGRFAFKNCTSLIEVTIPSTIGRWCVTCHTPVSQMQAQYNSNSFQGCTSLKKVTLTKGLKTLSYANAFVDCTSLKSITVPSTVTDLSYAFYNCEYLEEIILQEVGSTDAAQDEYLSAIGNKAFYGCSSLQKVNIPSTVTEINEAAFGGCSSLKTLTVPSSVTRFSGMTYIGTGLESVYLLAEKIELVDIQAFFSVSPGGAIYCIEGSSTYETYAAIAEKNGWSEGSVRVLTPEMAGVIIEGYQGVYDGEAHPLVALTGIKEGDQVSYRMVEEDGTTGESVQEVPKVKEPGTYTLEVALIRENVKYKKKIQVTIQKKTAVIQIEDRIVYEKDGYEITPKVYDGDGELVYTYYRDETMKKKCTGKPTAPGVYYVQAVVYETGYYLEGKSNIAKIEILEGSAPDTKPGEDPGIDPGTDPGTEPGKDSDTDPGTTPDTDPGTTADKQTGTGGSTAATDNQPSRKPSRSGKRSASAVKRAKKAATKAMKQAKVTKLTVKGKSKRITVSWKKVKKARGYQVQVSTNKKFKRNKIIYSKNVQKIKLAIKNKRIKSKKTYYIRVRAYTTYQDQNYKTIKVYGSWNKKLKKIKVK